MTFWQYVEMTLWAVIVSGAGAYVTRMAGWW
jgi:hypothetical protein